MSGAPPPGRPTRGRARPGRGNGRQRPRSARAGEAAVAEALRARIGSPGSPGIADRWLTLAGATVALIVESASGGHRELTSPSTFRAPAA